MKAHGVGRCFVEVGAAHVDTIGLQCEGDDRGVFRIAQRGRSICRHCDPDPAQHVAGGRELDLALGALGGVEGQGSGAHDRRRIRGAGSVGAVTSGAVLTVERAALFDLGGGGLDSMVAGTGGRAVGRGGCFGLVATTGGKGKDSK